MTMGLAVPLTLTFINSASAMANECLLDLNNKDAADVRVEDSLACIVGATAASNSAVVESRAVVS